jgi:hypothetical protein
MDLAFVGFNLYMYRCGGSFLWLMFACVWSIDGLRIVWNTDDDYFDNLINR